MKKLLFSLFVGLFGLISFCSALEKPYYFKTGTLTITDTSIYELYDFQNNNVPTNWQSDSICADISGVVVSTNNVNASLNIGVQEVGKMNNPNYRLYTAGFQSICMPLKSYASYINRLNVKFNNANYFVNGSLTIDYGLYYLSSLISSSGNNQCPSCPTCDEPYTSLECQTEYNLIPVEDVDINYCVSNQLCPACNYSGGISELYINDIQHNSAPLISINIPEEFDWDYTGNDEEFLLDVKGYNVDTEYISSIITTQNSKPNNIDFNNIVSGLIPLLVPGLVLIAFIYFVFRFVKKIF